jgi:hypothetical protein
MTQQDAARILRKDMDLSLEVQTKMKQIDAFLQQADKLLKECNYLVGSCIDYMNAPDDGGKNAPIPAWRGPLPNQHEAKLATKTITQLVTEAQPFLIEMDAFHKKFNACNQQVISYMEKIQKLFIKVNRPLPEPIILDAATIKNICTKMGKMPDYVLQMDAMVATILNYEQRMKSIKTKINIIKAVN